MLSFPDGKSVLLMVTRHMIYRSSEAVKANKGESYGANCKNKTVGDWGS